MIDKIRKEFEAQIQSKLGGLPTDFNVLSGLTKYMIEQNRSLEEKILILDRLSELAIGYGEREYISALMLKAEIFPDPISYSALANAFSIQPDGREEALSWSRRAVDTSMSQNRLRRYALVERIRMLLEFGMLKESAEEFDKLLEIGNKKSESEEDIVFPEEMLMKKYSEAFGEDRTKRYRDLI